jgi:hypothetical protein
MYQARTNIRNFVALCSHCEAKLESRLMFIQLSTAASPKQSHCSEFVEKRFSNHCKISVQFIGEVRLLRHLLFAKLTKTLFWVNSFSCVPRNDEVSDGCIFGGVGYAI